MESNQDSDTTKLLAAIADLEKRIGRIESYLQIQPEVEETAEVAGGKPRSTARDDEELEFEVGQKWFAKAGILVLAFGMAFVLTFPYQNLPSFLPSVFGIVMAGGMILVSRVWRTSFALVAQYLFGAGLVLSFFSVLRLFFFSPTVPLEASSPAGILLLVITVGAILAVSLRRQSVYLTGFSLIMGWVSLLAIDQPAPLLAGILLLAGAAVFIRLRYGWKGILAVGMIGTYLTFLVYILDNPFLGHDIQVIAPSAVALWLLLVLAALFASAVLRRENRETESVSVLIASGLNLSGSYALFLLLTLTTVGDFFILSHMAASAVFLALAVTFWMTEHSRFSTFLYAMFGYMALSVALMKAFSPPGLFVWLSLQSLLVLSTAIWFRSRFIVVANFFIFLAIILGYLLVTEGENGMSLGFGVVALVSARILNWQQNRLELKTEMMRNAYLTSAFIAFPYALYFLMPSGYVVIAWVGVALFYYLMSALIKKQKYRWMGHLTLGISVLYVMVIGIIQLEQTYRIFSFLLLGIVLLVVSLIFTRARARRKSGESEPPE